ncbi:hypothetical protein SRABI128_05429 [Microbacterium sp. Bi128]|nr:hypothetical protein SRABI128_05429 [Microbacterium sp. Bi128]
MEPVTVLLANSLSLPLIRKPKAPESSSHFRAVAVPHSSPGVLTFMMLLSASVLLV